MQKVRKITVDLRKKRIPLALYITEMYKICQKLITFATKQHSMARPIRNIPTLFGNEAQSFIREAERVEANPGTIKVQRKDINIMKQILREANML